MITINKLDLKKFEDNIVWRELKDNIEERERSLKDELATTSDIDEIRIMQGRLAEINDYLEFPERLLEASESERIEKEQDALDKDNTNELGENDE